MRRLIFFAVTILVLSVFSCTKPKHTTVSRLKGTTWTAATNECRKLIFDADSVTYASCATSVRKGYTVLSNDTVNIGLSNGITHWVKIIIKIAGDTLYYFAPTPYYNDAEKYYR